MVLYNMPSESVTIDSLYDFIKKHFIDSVHNHDDYEQITKLVLLNEMPNYMKKQAKFDRFMLDLDKNEIITKGKIIEFIKCINDLRSIKLLDLLVELAELEIDSNLGICFNDVVKYTDIKRECYWIWVLLRNVRASAEYHEHPDMFEVDTQERLETYLFALTKNLRIDLFFRNLGVGIENDESQHTNNSQAIKDEDKNAMCRMAHIALLRFLNYDVENFAKGRNIHIHDALKDSIIIADQLAYCMKVILGSYYKKVDHKEVDKYTIRLLKRELEINKNKYEKMHELKKFYYDTVVEMVKDPVAADKKLGDQLVVLEKDIEMRAKKLDMTGVINALDTLNQKLTDAQVAKSSAIAKYTYYKNLYTTVTIDENMLSAEEIENINHMIEENNKKIKISKRAMTKVKTLEKNIKNEIFAATIDQRKKELYISQNKPDYEFLVEKANIIKEVREVISKFINYTPDLNVESDVSAGESDDDSEGVSESDAKFSSENPIIFEMSIDDKKFEKVFEEKIAKSEHIDILKKVDIKEFFKNVYEDFESVKSEYRIAKDCLVDLMNSKSLISNIFLYKLRSNSSNDNKIINFIELCSLFRYDDNSLVRIDFLKKLLKRKGYKIDNEYIMNWEELVELTQFTKEFNIKVVLFKYLLLVQKAYEKIEDSKMGRAVLPEMVDAVANDASG